MNTRRPLVWLAAAFAMGVALAPVHAIPRRVAAACLVLAASPPLAPLGFAAAGLLVAQASRAPAATPPTEAPIEGRVDSIPERVDDRARFLVRERAGRLIEATVPEPAWPLALADRIRVRLRLRTPEGPRNPGGRDRAARQAARGVALEGFGTEPASRIAPPSPFAILEAARARFAAAATAALPPRQAALVRAIGAGDTSAMDPDTVDAFARSGLAHLLSVSGLHLAVVAFGLHRMLAWMLNRWDGVARRIDPRRTAALAAIPATLLYAVATGAQVPIVRSAIGAGAAFLGILLGREGDALNTLALAAIAILAAEPGALLDPSFQLSFASVAGLALLAAPLRAAIPIPRARGGRLAAAREALLTGVCASFAATVATMPIVAFYFRRIGLLGVPANLVAVPLGSALTVLGALAAMASAVAAPLATALLWLCGPVAALLLFVNDVFAAPAWGVVGLASPGIAGALACYVLALAAWRSRRLLRVACAIGSAAALVLPGCTRDLLARWRGGLEVVFLSVGQGDAALLRLPDGSAVLIDAGGEARGRYDPGARDVLPFLRDAGIRRIAAAFISHPHPDHLLGLPAVAAAMPVEHLFTNGSDGDDATRAAFARLPPALALAAGDRWERAGVQFEVLGPPRSAAPVGENDASLVLRVRYGATSLLFPGDIEAEGEAALGSQPIASDAVKVPHHGSRTSSGPAFVTSARPRFAIFCLGRDNRFGFPHPEAVERWRKAGADILRTDEGAVRLLSNGRRLRRTPAANALDVLALWREHAQVGAVW